MTGYNSNVEGREYGKLRYTVHTSGGPRYAEWRARAAANDDPDVVFS
jgi:hypothetical protein